jgi:23S rRNA (uracil1939-C5)-methyltransferase
VADARSNAAALGIGNARFEALDGAAGLRRFISSGEQFDLVIIDPPRSGADEMAGLLGEVKVSAVLYVSCDPQTLGRDLARLQQGGYRVVKSRVVDMFPQTYHIESITLLERV